MSGRVEKVETSEERAARVLALREQVRSGRYQVDEARAMEIAEAMLERAGMHACKRCGGLSRGPCRCDGPSLTVYCQDCGTTVQTGPRCRQCAAVYRRILRAARSTT